MRKSNLTFAEGFLGVQAASGGNVQKAFDWDKAAEIIKDRLKSHPNLTAEAGLQGDWNYTGGTIFENGKPTNDSYTYLSSNWAEPTLIIEWDGGEEEIECFSVESRFHSGSKWDETSLGILGINL